VPQFLCSLPNDKHAGGRRPQIITDDPDAIAAFSAKWDVPGRAVYRCVNPLKPGATRRRIETIAAIEQLHADVDVLKDLVETFEEVDTRLLHLPLQPTWVRDSGGGRHVIYALKEPASADDPEYFERAARALKRLTQALSADPAPAHAAALLREVGTHNTKRGDPVLVQTLWGSGEKVDLTDVEAMLDLLPESGLFQRKPITNGRADVAPKSAMRGDTNGPVDVDQRLADMTFEGPGVSGVHSTELSCTASLLRQGLSLQSAVLTVLEDTQKAVAGDPRTAGWNWAEEKVRLEDNVSTLSPISTPNSLLLSPTNFGTPLRPHCGAAGALALSTEGVRAGTCAHSPWSMAGSMAASELPQGLRKKRLRKTPRTQQRPRIIASSSFPSPA
jgi:hypothetical protein